MSFKAQVVALACALAAHTTSAQALDAPQGAPHRALRWGIAAQLGYEAGLGHVESGLPLSHLAYGYVPLGLTGSVEGPRGIAAGLSIEGQFGIADQHEGAAGHASVRGLRLGAEVGYHFHTTDTVDPWLAVEVVWQRLGYKRDDLDGGVDRRHYLARPDGGLSLGIDCGRGPLRFGPVLRAIVGTYRDYTSSFDCRDYERCDSDGIDGEVSITRRERRVHAFLFVGVRVRYGR